MLSLVRESISEENSNQGSVEMRSILNEYIGYNLCIQTFDKFYSKRYIKNFKNFDLQNDVLIIYESEHLEYVALKVKIDNFVIEDGAIGKVNVNDNSILLELY